MHDEASEAVEAPVLPNISNSHLAVPKLRFTVLFSGCGALSFLLVATVICSSGIGDPQLYQEWHAQVPQGYPYQWGMVAFGTSSALHLVKMVINREPVKFQLALLACYINLLSCITAVLNWIGWSPLLLSAWGHGFYLLRLMQWLHTGPAQLYLLSIISSYSAKQVKVVLFVDVILVGINIMVHFIKNPMLEVLLTSCGGVLFLWIIVTIWKMFDSPLSDVSDPNSKLTLQIIRMFTMAIWAASTIVDLIVRSGKVSINTEEWLWLALEFLGISLFSTALLHGNFLTMEQRREMERRLVEERNRIRVIQQLKHLVDQKENFMSSMSHELRTPLNGIIGLSEALLVGSCGAINEQTVKTITTIKTSGARLLTLINDILDAASMRQGKLIIKHEKIELQKVIEDVIALGQPLVRKGVKIINEVPGNLPPVLGDTGRILQIFYNLLGNAYKFTHEGFVAVGAQLIGDEVQIYVKDTGIGIPEEKLEQIFEPFQQVDMGTTRKYGGTGLGLSLVQDLINAHNSSISVTSKLGVGTTFSFKLKAWKPSDKDREATIINNATLEQRRASDSGSTHLRFVKKSSSFYNLLQDASPARSASPPASPLVTSSRMQPSRPTSPQHHHQQQQQQQDSLAQGVVKRSWTPPGLKRMISQNYDRMARSNPNPRVGGCSSADDVTSAMRTQATLAAAAGPTPTLRVRHSHADGVTPPGTKHKSGRAQKLRVLSVDDDPTNQLVMQNLLGPDGYEIICAMDGPEALDILASEPEMPDVILLDVMMPGMSGYEVCRTFRELYPLSCIPVIMVSAKSKEENIVDGLDAGCNDYLVKPLCRGEILARIQAHLRFRDDVFQAGKLAAGNTAHTEQHKQRLPSRLSASGTNTPMPTANPPPLAPATTTAGTAAAAASAGATAAAAATAQPGSSSADSEAVARLQHDKELLERQLEEVATEADRLQDLVDSMEADVAEKQRLQQVVLQLNQDNTRLQQAAADLGKEQAALEQAIAGLTSERDQLQQALNSLSSQYMLLQEAVEAAAAENMDVWQEAEAAKKQLTALEAAATDAAAETSQLKAQVAELEGRILELQHEALQQERNQSKAAASQFALKSRLAVATSQLQAAKVALTVGTSAVPLLHHHHHQSPRPAPRRWASAHAVSQLTHPVARRFSLGAVFQPEQLVPPTPSPNQWPLEGSPGTPFTTGSTFLSPACHAPWPYTCLDPTPQQVPGFLCHKNHYLLPLLRKDVAHTHSDSHTGATSDTSDLCQLLEDLGLSDLEPQLRAQQITPAQVLQLDDSGLKALGAVSMGARLKLRLAAQDLLAGPPR